MYIGKSSNGRRNMNFELNLVPFIDVLSTCICFLLVTTVFMNLGSFQVSQAIGDAKAKQEKKIGSVTLSMGSKGDVRFELKDVSGYSGSRSVVTIRGDRGQIDYKSIGRWLESFTARAKDVKTVLILPNPTSQYDDIIQLMAQMKRNRLDQIGIAPL